MTNEKKKDPVRKWTLIVLALCIVLFVIYLVGDRVAPFTSQAKVHAYVRSRAPGGRQSARGKYQEQPVGQGR